MRGRLAFLLVGALLLAGCSGGDEKEITDDPGAQSQGSLLLTAPQAAPLRFASGAFTGNLTGESTFSIARQCAFDCADGQDIIDLTSIVPANAPVELSIKVHGAHADLEFVDAYALGTEDPDYGEYDGQATDFAPVVIRGDTGQVLLHVFNPGGFNVPPEPAPTAAWEAASVVRADVLIPGVPAQVRLAPGQQLNLTSPAIEEAVLFAPDGSSEVLASEPFTFTANATGLYTLLMDGAEATPVTGPNVTMTARRIAYMESEEHALQSGGETAWSFNAPTRPIMAGIQVRNNRDVATPFGSFGAMVFATQLQVRLVAPGNVAVVDEAFGCQPTCGPMVLGDGFSFGASSEYLDGRLAAGDYQAVVAYTGNGLVAVSWTVGIL